MELSTVSSDFFNWARALPKKQRAELDAVINFLQHQGADRLSPADFVMSPSEPIDIQYEDHKFQVVHADFGFQEALGKATSTTGGSTMISGPSRDTSELWRALILDPLKKKNHYGSAANGITLLISTHLSTSLVEKNVALAQKLGSDRELARLGFDAIYLVGPQETLKLFPAKTENLK